MTPEEIETLVRSEHPEFRHSQGDQVTVITPTSNPVLYEQMIAERVQWRIEQQDRDAIATASQDELALAKGVYQKLKNGTATQNEAQRFLALIGKHVYRLVGNEAE